MLVHHSHVLPAVLVHKHRQRDGWHCFHSRRSVIQTAFIGNQRMLMNPFILWSVNVDSGSKLPSQFRDNITTGGNTNISLIYVLLEEHCCSLYCKYLGLLELI